MAPFYSAECELTVGKSFASEKEARKLERGDQIKLREGMIGESTVIVVNDDVVVEKNHPRFKPIACNLRSIGSNGEIRHVVNQNRLSGRINLVQKKSVVMEASKTLLEWRKK